MDSKKIDIYNEELKCHAPMPVIDISPELPENIKEQLIKALHMVGHMLVDGQEIHCTYVMMARNGDIHLLDMAGAPNRNEMAKFAALHANRNDIVAIVAAGEGWNLPIEVNMQLFRDGVPDDFVVSEHPAAFEALNVQIETINGIWCGLIPLSKYEELADGEVDGKPRTYTAEKLELNKVDISEEYGRYMYPPSLVWNMLASTEASDAPEIIKVIARAAMQRRIEEKEAEWAEEDKAKAKADKPVDPQ